MNRNSHLGAARALLPAILLLTAAVCLAQDKPAPAYDLPTVIETALERHPALQAGALDVTAAQAKVRQVQAHFRPRISAEAGYTRLQEDPTFSVAGFGTMHFGAADNWTANLGVEYPLYTGGKLEGMKAGAEAGVRVSEDQLARQRQTVAVNAARAYYRLLEADRLLPVITDQVKALEEVVRTATAMSEQGVVAKIDVLRAQVALAGAQGSLQELSASHVAAIAMLVEAMGLPPGSPVEVKDTDTPAPTPTLSDELWQKAWEQRRDLQAVAAQKRALQAQVDIARSELKPQIGLFARSEFERPTFYPETGTLSGGIMIRQQLSDGGAARQAAAEAQARLDQLERVEEQMKYGIAVQVQVAMSGISSARARLETTAPAVSLAREALRLTQVGYANGVMPLTDVLQAQAALTKASADYEGALSALRQSLVELDYAMGKLDAPAATPAG
jgi:outer membrane protein